MPDPIIKKVESFGKFNALLGTFNSPIETILFEWIEEVDGCPDGIVEAEDAVLLQNSQV